MSSAELLCARQNWNRVILEGRKPGQTIAMGCEEAEQPLRDVGRALFEDFSRVAEVLDREQDEPHYQKVCEQLVASFDDPELTYSARTLQALKEGGIAEVGAALAEQYRHMLSEEPLEVLTEEAFSQQALASINKQKALEEGDTLSLEEYLASRKG
jgi:glutamate--cysteine ligase